MNNFNNMGNNTPDINIAGIVNILEGYYKAINTITDKTTAIDYLRNMGVTVEFIMKGGSTNSKKFNRGWLDKFGPHKYLNEFIRRSIPLLKANDKVGFYNNYNDFFEYKEVNTSSQKLVAKPSSPTPKADKKIMEYVISVGRNIDSIANDTMKGYSVDKVTGDLIMSVVGVTMDFTSNDCISTQSANSFVDKVSKSVKSLTQGYRNTAINYFIRRCLSALESLHDEYNSECVDGCTEPSNNLVTEYMSMINSEACRLYEEISKIYEFKYKEKVDSIFSFINNPTGDIQSARHVTYFKGDIKDFLKGIGLTDNGLSIFIRLYIKILDNLSDSYDSPSRPKYVPISYKVTKVDCKGESDEIIPFMELATLTDKSKDFNYVVNCSSSSSIEIDNEFSAASKVLYSTLPKVSEDSMLQEVLCGSKYSTSFSNRYSNGHLMNLTDNSCREMFVEILGDDYSDLRDFIKSLPDDGSVYYILNCEQA